MHTCFAQSVTELDDSVRSLGFNLKLWGAGGSLITARGRRHQNMVDMARSAHGHLSWCYPELHRTDRARADWPKK
jgi:hypothetical protein